MISLRGKRFLQYHLASSRDGRIQMSEIAYQTPPTFTSVRAAFVHGSALLRTHASPTATLDIECLLQCVLQMPREQLYTHFSQPLQHAQQAQLHTLLQRRLQGEPIAYLTGRKEFYGRSFSVDRRVLIPRPATEQLITLAKELLPADAALQSLDIGTGSGCLGITLALEFEHSHVTAWEIDPAALVVAQHNAHRLGCRNITFQQHDIFATLPTATPCFDLIVANPPYITAAEKTTLPPAVLDYEPHRALFADECGLSCYRRIAQIAPQLLHRHGLLNIELNPTTASATETLFSAQGFQVIQRGQDLQGLTRTLTLHIPER